MGLQFPWPKPKQKRQDMKYLGKFAGFQAKKDAKTASYFGQTQ